MGEKGGAADHLRHKVEAVKAARAEALAKAAEHIRAKAVEKTPILTGNLRASAHVVVHGPDTAEVIYPGPYARYQHYMLNLRHPRGGQALYLETTVVEEHDKVLEIIAEELGKAVKE